MISRRSLFKTIAAAGAWLSGAVAAVGASRGLRVKSLPHDGPVGDGVALTSMSYPHANPYDLIRAGQCNCMGTFSSGRTWMPYRKVGDDFYTFNGLKGLSPPEWRMMEVESIVAEMDERGDIPINFGQAMSANDQEWRTIYLFREMPRNVKSKA